MKELWIFLGGFITAMFVIPILQGICDIILSGITYLVTITNKHTAEEAVKIREIECNDAEEIHTDLIGF